MKQQRKNYFRVIPFIICTSIVGLMPFASHAATSDWATTKGGRMRIVTLPPRDDGTVPTILQIELEKGWKTYWREPGSAGIPPQVIVNEGGNAALSRLRFPVPSIFDDGKTKDYGYEGSVSIVLDVKRLDPQKPVGLNAQVFLGLCEKICVPFQAELSVMTDAKDRIVSAEAALIAQAEMQLPEPASDDFRIVQAFVLPSGTEISVKAKLPDMKSVQGAKFIATNSDGIAFSDAEIVDVTGTTVSIRFNLRNPTASYSLNGKPVQILILAGDRSMETALAFE